jgi:L-rhamnose mutarotase
VCGHVDLLEDEIPKALIAAAVAFGRAREIDLHALSEVADQILTRLQPLTFTHPLRPWRAKRYDSPVIRKAFRLSVHPGCEAEYERRHRPIWDELERILIRHGVQIYSIFIDSQTNDLFGYVELEDEARWAAIGQTDVCRRWWRHMREIMPSNPDDSPISRELREVFHIEAG